jgi:hypothetical protein
MSPLLLCTRRALPAICPGRVGDGGRSAALAVVTMLAACSPRSLGKVELRPGEAPASRPAATTAPAAQPAPGPEDWREFPLTYRPATNPKDRCIRLAHQWLRPVSPLYAKIERLPDGLTGKYECFVGMLDGRHERRCRRDRRDRHDRGGRSHGRRRWRGERRRGRQWRRGRRAWRWRHRQRQEEQGSAVSIPRGRSRRGLPNRHGPQRQDRAAAVAQARRQRRQAHPHGLQVGPLQAAVLCVIRSTPVLVASTTHPARRPTATKSPPPSDTTTASTLKGVPDRRPAMVCRCPSCRSRAG